MNQYLKNLDKIEFIVTNACTGRCKHCSQGSHSSSGEHIAPDSAASAVIKTAEAYNINTLMTFGGEPLLFPDTVCRIHSAGRSAGIRNRQLITNGFFSRKADRIREVAYMLAESGVNDILLSVDAFHQETIPVEPVMTFAENILKAGITKLRTHPAWLVSPDDDNPYNNKTREILEVFRKSGIEPSDGNIIFPSGSALKFLGEYFSSDTPRISVYAQDPKDIKAISISSSGDVLGGNIYKTDIIEILEHYAPNK